jgi:predicted nucleotidyltransferase
MMAACDRHILDLFAARVRERFTDADVWAFGSRARGDATRESDLDVCVVDDHLTHADDYTIGDIAWEVGFEYGLVIIPICFSREAFERGPMSASTLVANILREGIAA